MALCVTRSIETHVTPLGALPRLLERLGSFPLQTVVNGAVRRGNNGRRGRWGRASGWGSKGMKWEWRRR